MGGNKPVSMICLLSDSFQITPLIYRHHCCKSFLSALNHKVRFWFTVCDFSLAFIRCCCEKVDKLTRAEMQGEGLFSRSIASDSLLFFFSCFQCGPLTRLNWLTACSVLLELNNILYVLYLFIDLTGKDKSRKNTFRE